MNKEEMVNACSTEVTADTLVIRCFGGLSVSLGEKTIPHHAWRGPSAKGLFVYLVLNGPTPREKLMDLFWPEHDPQAASNNFSSMLRYVRNALQTLDRASRKFIPRDGPFYAFRPTCPYAVDVQEFKRQINLARRADPIGSEKITYYCAALQFYRDRFLPELYDDWATREQDWLQELYLDAAGELGTVYLQRREFFLLLSLTQQMLRVDLCCEGAYQLMLEADLATGQPVKGLRHYQQMEHVLADELGVSPNGQLQALHMRLSAPQPIAC